MLVSCKATRTESSGELPIEESRRLRRTQATHLMFAAGPRSSRRRIWASSWGPAAEYFSNFVHLLPLEFIYIRNNFITFSWETSPASCASILGGACYTPQCKPRHTAIWVIVGRHWLTSRCRRRRCAFNTNIPPPVSFECNLKLLRSDHSILSGKAFVVRNCLTLSKSLRVNCTVRSIYDVNLNV